MEVAGAAKGRALKVLAVVVGLGLLGAGGWYGYRASEDIRALRDSMESLEGENATLLEELEDIEIEVSTLQTEVSDLYGASEAGLEASVDVYDLAQRVQVLERAVGSAGAQASSLPPIQLTSDARLRAALNAACKEARGANATPGGHETFRREFHAQEREQQEQARQGQDYYQPDPEAAAMQFAETRSGACY